MIDLTNWWHQWQRLTMINDNGQLCLKACNVLMIYLVWAITYVIFKVCVFELTKYSCYLPISQAAMLSKYKVLHIHSFCMAIWDKKVLPKNISVLIIYL